MPISDDPHVDVETSVCISCVSTEHLTECMSPKLVRSSLLFVCVCVVCLCSSGQTFKTLVYTSKVNVDESIQQTLLTFNPDFGRTMESFKVVRNIGELDLWIETIHADDFFTSFNIGRECFRLRISY